MIKPIRLLPLFLLVGSLMSGQNRGDKTPFSTAEEFRKIYRFDEAIRIFKEIYDTCSDYRLKEKSLKSIALCENGISMLAYGTTPFVRGSFVAPLKEFFLYYPDMPDSTWSLVPLFLNRNKSDYSLNNVMRFDTSSNTQYFSAQDSSGRWDIYQITRIDSLRWSYPEPLDMVINSSGDELFPLLSGDRKKLYFSSDGHYGIGGFDLYVSLLDEATGNWGEPVNLGFPYSSTGNDYLYIDTYSGKYSVLASDRDISQSDSVTLHNSLSAGDSIKIYVLGYENLPVKRAIPSAEEALRISRLIPEDLKNRSVAETKETVRVGDTSGFLSNNIESGYSKMMREARKIEAEIDSTQKQINQDRSLLATLTNNDDRILLEKRIFEAEFELIEQQSRLRSVKQMVQEQEMEFLSKGIIIPRDLFAEEESLNKIPDPEVSEEISFRLLSYGIIPELEIVEPEPVPDLTFRIAEESVIMDNFPLPDGLLYTVQLFMLSYQTDVSTFKGIYPVFEERTPTGKYIYTAGRFSTYAELSAAFNKIRSMRFNNAITKACYQGKPMSIREARVLEEKLLKEQSYQVVIEDFPEGLPQPVIDIIRQNSDKDVALKVIEGKNVYFIGPYTTRADAERLTGILSSVSGSVRIEVIKQK